MNLNIKVLAVYIHRPVKITLHLVNKMQCGGRSSEWLLSLLFFPVVPPAAGNPAETRESACLKHEVTVDAAALNYPPPTNQRPSRRLLSSNHPAGSQTYLQTCYCMCSESHTQRSIHAPYERNGTTAASNLEKRGFHVLWLQRVTRSWPRPRARLSIPLLCRRYMGTWLWSRGRGNEEKGGLPAEVNVDVFTLQIHHHVNWIQLLLWSPWNVLFELTIMRCELVRGKSGSAVTF